MDDNLKLDDYSKADLLIRISRLEDRINKLESKQNRFNGKVLKAIQEIVDYVSKWKHPVSRVVVTLSVILSTAINQLPYILSLFT